jgi:hypothetical protein
MDNKDLEFTIRRGILDNAPRKLILNPKYIKFESNDLAINPFITFEYHEITEFRFGMKWISLEVTFGREYFIYIRNNKKEVMKINFKTYFGNKKTEYQNLYREIIINLEKLYFGNIVDEYLKKYQREESFKIGEVSFSKDFVKIGVSRILKDSENIILWKNLRIKEYQTYITIYSVEDPKNINRVYSYFEDWNSLVLCSFLKSILNYKQIGK